MDINHITNKEEKLKLAKKIAEKVKNGQVIGFGSGSTSYLAAIEIGKRVKEEKLNITAIPTSEEIAKVCEKYKISIGNLTTHELDWAFDGADEVDPKGNMIKGMGAAMFREKLNILSSPINYILVDDSKFVERLGEKHPIPIEVFPSSMRYVSERLTKLGAISTVFRGMTENNNAILDTEFEKIDDKLEEKIKVIPGVIESGLFIGYNVEVIRN